MPQAPAPVVQAAPPGGLVPLDVGVTRTLLRYGSALALGGGLVLGAGLQQVSLPARVAMVLLGLALSLAFGLASRQTEARRLGASLLAVMTCAVLALIVVAYSAGLGVHSVTYGLAALIITLTGAMLGTRAGLWLAGLATAGLLGLAFHGVSAPGLSGLLAPWSQQRLLANLFTVMCGAWGAFLLGGVLRRSLAQREQREQMYRGLFARSASALVLHRHWQVIEANDAAARLFGFEHPGQMTGVDLRRFYDEEAVRRGEARMAWLLSQPQGAMLEPIEFSLHDLTGRPLQVTSTASAVTLADGPAIEALFMDVGGLRQAERVLLRSEAMLSRLFAAHPDGVAVMDAATGGLVLVNPAFSQMSGHQAVPADAPTAPPPALWADAQAPLPPAGPRQPGQELDGVSATLCASDGRRLAVRVSAAAFELEGRVLQVFTCRDVSVAERTRLEYEATLQAALIGIAYTRDGRFVHGNRRCEAMFGWGPGELVGRTGRAFWASDEEYAEIGRLYGPTLARGEAIDAERLMTRSDGSRFLCRLRAQAIDRHHPSQGGTIWLFEDITEQHRTREALAQARDAAEAASRAKSAFLANMSHEIRTPLNALIGLARLAQGDDLSASRQRDYLRQLLDSAEALSDLVSDTLDLAKIEAGQFTLDPRPFPLHELLRAGHAAWQPLADARGLGFQLLQDERLPPWVLGDPLRLRQIIGNYVANALKFTEHGDVQLAARCVADGVIRFEVTDTGPGIPAEMQGRLFQPFMQADTSTTRRHGGTGLGLSICRELAQLMGGEVGLRSQPGQGSCFWVQLPLPAAAPAAGSALTGAPVTPHALRGLRVLVAEDNEVNMLITVALLEQWGLVVVQARDGATAVERVLQAHRAGQPFDVVLMDVHMPVMDGHQAAHRLRRDFSARQLPIIALTASVLVSERQQALAAGMDAVLSKPVQSLLLQAELQRLTVQRRVAAGPPGSPTTGPTPGTVNDPTTRLPAA